MDDRRDRRARLLTKQPINWAFIDLITPLPWQTNVFTTTNPFIYRAPERERVGPQPHFYSGQVRRVREDDDFQLTNDEPFGQIMQRTRERDPEPSIGINLAGTMTGRGVNTDSRNPLIRHPPYSHPTTGEMLYHGSTLPTTIHLPLSGYQHHRPTHGAAPEA